MTRYGMMWVSALIMLKFNGSASSVQPPPNNGRPQRLGQSQSLSDTTKEPSTPVTAVSVNPEPRPEQSRSSSKQKTSSDTTNVILVVFTGLLVVVGLFQWLALKATVAEAGRASARQSADMQDSIKAALVGAQAAKEAADATRASVAKMQEIGETQLRAYVGVQAGSGTTQDFDTTTLFELDPILVNTGQTPATQLHHTGRIAILPFPLPASFDFPLAPLAEERSTGVIGAGQQYRMFVLAERMFTREELAELVTGQKRLFVYGIVHYSDVFERDRTTKFCYYVLGNPTTAMWILTNRHNAST